MYSTCARFDLLKSPEVTLCGWLGCKPSINKYIMLVEYNTTPDEQSVKSSCVIIEVMGALLINTAVVCSQWLGHKINIVLPTTTNWFHCSIFLFWHDGSFCSIHALKPSQLGHKHAWFPSLLDSLAERIVHSCVHSRKPHWTSGFEEAHVRAEIDSGVSSKGQHIFALWCLHFCVWSF